MATTTTATAISDLGVALWKKGATKYEFLIPVKSAPATGGAPAQIDVTVLSSAKKMNILDRQETPAYDFDYNYTATNYEKALLSFDGKTENEFMLTFGDKSGFKFSGIGATWTDAISAGSAIVGKISIAVTSSEWTKDASLLVDATTVPVGLVTAFGAV